MKCVLLIVLFIAYCAALEHKLQVTNVPQLSSVQNVNLTRIIGGNSASIQKYPFAVQMLYNKRLICGGSLITLRHVLTAAHCFYDSNGYTLLRPQDFSIIAGSANYQRGGTTRTLSRVVIHPYYNSPLRDNDVAVLVLNKNLRSSNSIRAALLPPQWDQTPDNAVVWAIGWGTTVFGMNAPPSTLQEVQLWTINRTVCAQRYLGLEAMRPPGEQYRVTTNMICSGVQGGGRDACQGDSGGPLIYSGIVVGVTSWGWDCAHPTYPGVNAMTSAYTNWINQTVTLYNAGPPVGTISGLVLLASLVSALLSSQL